MKDSILRSALSNIIKGYTYEKERKMYIKHLCLDDYIDYEEKYDEYFEGLKKRGVETKEELMARVISQGLWSDKKNLEMEEVKASMESSQEGYDKCPIPSMKEEMKKILQESQAKYYLMLAEKESFTAQSCENLTNKKLSEYFVLKSLFKDSKFEIPFLSPEELDDADFDPVPYISLHNKLINEQLGEQNIKRIAISPIFKRSWLVVKNAYYYFGKPVAQLSFFQTSLIEWAQEFTYISENFPKIQGDDPDKILEAAKFASEAQSKSKEDGKTTYMMSNEEAAQAGIRMPDRTAQFNEALEKT